MSKFINFVSMLDITTQSFCLNTGAKMPVLGLGTWKSLPGDVGVAVTHAITECGYRHVDCAYIYHNEKEIGEAFSFIFGGGQVKRDEVFVTSKLWNDRHDPAEVEEACRRTLSDLQLDYLDLYLMHWGLATSGGKGSRPVGKNSKYDLASFSVRETWEAMEKLVEKGLVKSIGVANFTGAMLIDMLSYTNTTPAVNQIELHPYLQQERLIEFCNEMGIAVTAYSPLGSPGNRDEQEHLPLLIEDEAIGAIAKNYGKSPAQILIRWALLRNTIVIPKSVNPGRIAENAKVFDFFLSAEDMEVIAGLDKKMRTCDLWDWSWIPYFD